MLAYIPYMDPMGYKQSKRFINHLEDRLRNWSASSASAMPKGTARARPRRPGPEPRHLGPETSEKMGISPGKVCFFFWFWLDFDGSVMGF